MANEEIKVIADKEDIVAIADKVRTLDGVSSAYTINGIANSVEAANSEIDVQAAKIAELSIILDGKAGSSGGANIETCTVRPYFHNSAYAGASGTYCATVFRNGSLTNVSGTWDGNITMNNPITDVVCGSVFCLNVRSDTVLGPYGGAILLDKAYNSAASFYSMPTTAGADVQLFASNEIT